MGTSHNAKQKSKQPGIQPTPEEENDSSISAFQASHVSQASYEFQELEVAPSGSVGVNSVDEEEDFKEDSKEDVSSEWDAFSDGRCSDIPLESFLEFCNRSR